MLYYLPTPHVSILISIYRVFRFHNCRNPIYPSFEIFVETQQIRRFRPNDLLWKPKTLTCWIPILSKIGPKFKLGSQLFENVFRLEQVCCVFKTRGYHFYNTLHLVHHDGVSWEPNGGRQTKKQGVGNLKSGVRLFLAALSQKTRGLDLTATLDDFNQCTLRS